MKRLARLDLLVGLGLLAAGGLGLTWQVDQAQASNPPPALVCPLGPHLVVVDAPGAK